MKIILEGFPRTVLCWFARWIQYHGWNGILCYCQAWRCFLFREGWVSLSSDADAFRLYYYIYYSRLWIGILLWSTSCRRRLNCLGLVRVEKWGYECCRDRPSWPLVRVYVCIHPNWIRPYFILICKESLNKVISSTTCIPPMYAFKVLFD
jgi:hypothetical protein